MHLDFNCGEALQRNFRQLIHLLLSYLGRVLVQTILHNYFTKTILSKEARFFLAHLDFDGKICELFTAQYEFFESDTKKKHSYR